MLARVASAATCLVTLLVSCSKPPEGTAAGTSSSSETLGGSTATTASESGAGTVASSTSAGSAASTSSSGFQEQCELFEEPDVRVEVDAPDADDTGFGILFRESCTVESVDANTVAFACANEIGSVTVAVSGIPPLDLTQLPSTVVVDATVSNGFESSGTRLSILDADEAVLLAVVALPSLDVGDPPDAFDPLALSTQSRDCAPFSPREGVTCSPALLNITGPEGSVQLRQGDQEAIPGGWIAAVSAMAACHAPDSPYADQARFAIVHASLVVP